MNGRINRLGSTGEAGEYIWLRYGTQFTMNGRSHTIEMSIPMPIGADEETREQLLREADAGMNQLAEHVENRVAKMLQRAQPTQGKIPAPTPIARSSPQPRPASMPAPQTGPQPLQSAPLRTREGRSEPVAPSTNARTREKEVEPVAPMAAQNEGVTVPPTRPNVGASMPSIPAGDSSGNLSLQQFIGYIRENMGLNPKQAMDHLKIKTLSGINLRDALEQLQKIIGQETTTGAQSKAHETVPATRPGANAIPATPANPPTPSASTNNAAKSPAAGTERSNESTLNEEGPVYIFDEEVEPEEDEELEDFDLPREFSAQERVKARNKLDGLQASRGATAVSPGRLQVLNNVVSSQISSEQLQELIEGVWEVTSIKKLKVDQAEALISWAKEDDFVNEVEVVLAILEEG
ncbi:MAG TPA: hypothetical protein VEL31_28765 [Ktedonobacteraceae bacterium]|nr:hypothetical protein [Ktedonobacteraceae bacterium]